LRLYDPAEDLLECHVQGVLSTADPGEIYCCDHTPDRTFGNSHDPGATELVFPRTLDRRRSKQVLSHQAIYSFMLFQKSQGQISPPGFEQNQRVHQDGRRAGTHVACPVRAVLKKSRCIQSSLDQVLVTLADLRPDRRGSGESYRSGLL